MRRYALLCIVVPCRAVPHHVSMMFPLVFSLVFHNVSLSYSMLYSILCSILYFLLHLFLYPMLYSILYPGMLSPCFVHYAVITVLSWLCNTCWAACIECVRRGVHRAARCVWGHRQHSSIIHSLVPSCASVQVYPSHTEHMFIRTYIRACLYPPIHPFVSGCTCTCWWHNHSLVSFIPVSFFLSFFFFSLFFFFFSFSHSFIHFFVY